MMSQENIVLKEETLASFTVGLRSFLIAKGYSVPQDFPQRFFELAVHMDEACFPDIRDYEPVFETLVITAPGEHFSFHDDYISFVENRRVVIVSDGKATQLRLRKHAQLLASEDERRESERAERLAKKIAKMEHEISQEDKKSLASRKKLDALREQIEELSKELEAAFDDPSVRAKICKIPEMAAHDAPIPPASECDEMRGAMKAASKKAIRGKSAMKVIKLLDELAELLKKAESYRRNSGWDSIASAKEQLVDAREKADDARGRFEELVEKMNAEALREVEKDRSPAHREEFGLDHALVSSIAEGDTVLGHEFSSMTVADRERISAYVKENARKFKTRMTRNIRTGQRRTIDIPATCKRACSSLGVPLKLEFVKPKRNKARLMMFLDVSGSCKEASEMMLVFMHAMREVFPGGCRTYAFVDSLHDVSAVFDSVDASRAAEAVLSRIPTHGVYSDYHAPFADFVANHMNEVTSDTIVFFIGDARNNRNPTGTDNIKAIARRAKRAYWVNTEVFREWDTGDSVMSAYSPYMTRVCQATTPAELLGFLSELR